MRRLSQLDGAAPGRAPPARGGTIVRRPAPTDEARGTTTGGSTVGPPPIGTVRRLIAVGLAALALAGPTGCGWFADDPTWTVRTISTDGTDDYHWSGSADGVVVAAPDTDEGINLRQVATPDVAPSRDQSACATWNGPVEGKAQPGIALRVRQDGDRVRAITFTDNIWSAARHRWNVHLADSAAERPMDQQADETLVGFASSLADLPSVPWRLCARVRGTTFEAKVWAPADEPEPDWDDPEHGYAVEVPDEWVFDGRPGIYAGHLSPGEETTFSDWATTAD